MRRLPALLLVLSLGACADTSSVQTNLAMTRWGVDQSSKELVQCIHGSRTSDDFKPLLDRIPLFLHQASIEQQMNRNFISDEEKTAVVSLHPRWQTCRKSTIERAAIRTPEMVPILTEAVVAADQRLIALLRREISWGEYIQQSRRYEAERFNPAVEAQMRKIEGKLYTQQQNDIARETVVLTALEALITTAAVVATLTPAPPPTVILMGR